MKVDICKLREQIGDNPAQKKMKMSKSVHCMHDVHTSIKWMNKIMNIILQELLPHQGWICRSCRTVIEAIFNSSSAEIFIDKSDNCRYENVEAIQCIAMTAMINVNQKCFRQKVFHRVLTCICDDLWILCPDEKECAFFMTFDFQIVTNRMN